MCRGGDDSKLSAGFSFDVSPWYDMESDCGVIANAHRRPRVSLRPGGFHIAQPAQSLRLPARQSWHGYPAVPRRVAEQILGAAHERWSKARASEPNPGAGIDERVAWLEKLARMIGVLALSATIPQHRIRPGVCRYCASKRIVVSAAGGPVIASIIEAA